MPTPDFKTNAEDELLIRHPETNTWVPAVANLNVAGGFVVSLSQSQETLLDDIKAEVAKIDIALTSLDNIDIDATSIFNQLQDIQSLVLSIQSLLDVVKTSIVTAIEPDLTSVDDHAQSIDIKVAEIKTKLDAISTHLFDGANSVISRLQEIALATDTLETKSQSISDSLRLGSDTTILKLFENTGLVEEVRDSLKDTLGNTAISRISELLIRLEEVKAALDDGTETALTVLQDLKDYQSWETPLELTGATPIINGVNATTAGNPVSIPVDIERISFQCYFSDPSAVLTMLVEMRKGIGGIFNYQRKFKQYQIPSSSYNIAPNLYPGEDWIELESLGCAELVVHVVSVSAGTVTVYGQGYKRLS